MSPTVIPISTIITASATHWSCGQYVSATTGARLKPSSITTAPVTTGGRIAVTTRPPTTCTIRPTTSSVAPATSMAPVTSALVPPCARMAATAPTNATEVPR